MNVLGSITDVFAVDHDVLGSITGVLRGGS
jgi:hypothetical protein